MGARDRQFHVTDPCGNSEFALWCVTETSSPLAMTVLPALTVSEKVYVGLAAGKSLSGIQSSVATGSVVRKLPSGARNQPSVVPSPSLCTPGLPVYLTVTVNTEPSLIGRDGVMTSLFAGHWVPLSEFIVAELVDDSSGEQAGGSGLWSGPPTGSVCDA